MEVRAGQKWRGNSEVTTQVPCHSAIASDTNGTQSFQSLTLLDEGHTSSSTRPREESPQLQQLTLPGCWPNGTTIVPAALKGTRLNLSEGKRHVQNSTQRGMRLLQKPEGCGKKLSSGSSEETHGKKKKRQSTSMSYGSSPTLTPNLSTSVSRSAHQKTTLMEGSSTIKASHLQVTGTGVRPCPEISENVRAWRGTRGHVRSVRGATGSEPLSRIRTTAASMSSGNWVRAPSQHSHDTKMLQEERWPSINESVQIKQSTMLPGCANETGSRMPAGRGVTGPISMNRDCVYTNPTYCTGHRPKLKPIMIPKYSHPDRGKGQSKPNLASSRASRKHSSPKYGSKKTEKRLTRGTFRLLGFRCEGRKLILVQAPETTTRFSSTSLPGRKTPYDKAQFTSPAKRNRHNRAAGALPNHAKRRSPTVLDHRGRPTPTIASRTQNAAVSNAVSSYFEQVQPILMMANKDFIVTSPVEENLLLTIALSQHRARSGTSAAACVAHKDGHFRPVTNVASCGQILVGYFIAISSFMGFGLGKDAMRVAREQNAGGSSTISESLSVEYFVRRFQARNVVTEMEVEYSIMNMKKVDYICTLRGERVGVSVTRAMSYPDPRNFTEDTAVALLRKKLFGLVVARSGVTNRHSFSFCILHIWCETRESARILEKKYPEISMEMQVEDDVIMVLTVAEGLQARPIFYQAYLNSTAGSSTRTSLWRF